ncbi:MAG: NAD(P)-binding protein [Chloroflexi bacterium]|nr:NAD(P)-binding protein [Chloroflexota bacterium]
MKNSDKSFWLATYGPYTPNPPLKGDLRADVAIIGGGFTGLSAAYHLRKESPGTQVRLAVSHAIRGYMRVEDRAYERKMPQ